MEKDKHIVARMWRGRVPAEKAAEYRAYLLANGIEPLQQIEGNLGVQVLVRTEQDKTEFTVISYWASHAAIRQFAGENIDQPRRLPRDADFLVEPPKQVLHYDVEYNYIEGFSKRVM